MSRNIDEIIATMEATRKVMEDALEALDMDIIKAYDTKEMVDELDECCNSIQITVNNEDAQSTCGKSRCRAKTVKHSMQPSTKEVVLRVLDHSAMPMSVKEISTKLLNDGHQTSSNDFTAVVGHALTRLKKEGKVERYNDGWLAKTPVNELTNMNLSLVEDPHDYFPDDDTEITLVDDDGQNDAEAQEDYIASLENYTSQTENNPSTTASPVTQNN